MIKTPSFNLSLLLVLIGCFIAAIAAGQLRPTPINPHIKALPFVWPVGCERKDYYEKDRIAYACLSSDYQILNWSEYHWSEFKNVRYYRVGNDALSASCGGWVQTNKYCTVNYGIIKNAFHQ